MKKEPTKKNKGQLKYIRKKRSAWLDVIKWRYR